MIDRNTPSDPRLRERRGDLVGINALVFAVALIIALSIAAFLVLNFVPDSVAGLPTNTPRPTPGVATPSASTSARPSPTGSGRPAPTPTPIRTPDPSPSAVVAVSTTVGTETPLLIGGDAVGTVTAVTPELRRRIDGTKPPAGQRWAAVEIRLTASQGFDYSADDWLIEDSNGDRHAWAHVDPPPPLGEGRMTIDESVTGWVSFAIPLDVAIASVVLQTPDGQDLVIFNLP